MGKGKSKRWWGWNGKKDMVVPIFKTALAELTFKDDSLIKDLTEFAKRETHHVMVKIIEERFKEIPPGHMLPLMYLLDSMCKNLPGYMNRFSKNLVSNFAFAFKQVSVKDRSQLYQLRVTWGEARPPLQMFKPKQIGKILQKLNLRIREMDPA